MTEHQLSFFPPSRPLAERFGVEFFRNVPERPGVYLMCSAEAGVLYVGKAKNLRRRLAAYRSANPERLSRKLRRLLMAVSRIHWDECPDEAAALERERTLLLALRPRFNTIGVYPAPAQHLGWRWTDDGFLLGVGEATDGWERRHGPFTRLKPVWAALLRLAWRALYPGAALHEMPLPMIARKPPKVWLFSNRKPGSTNIVEEFENRLAVFLQGTSSDLPDWLLQSAPTHSRFEETWREQDALCLHEFQKRFHPLRSHDCRLPGEDRLDSANVLSARGDWKYLNRLGI